MEKCGDHTGAGASYGVAQRDGAAVHVELLVGYLEFLLDRAGCRGEGFVVLEEVYVMPAFFSTCLVVGIGASMISSGATPRSP